MTRKIKIEYWIHFFLWIFLFSFPLIFVQAEAYPVGYIFVKNWLPLIFAGILFYLNYFILINRFLFHKNATLFILINVTLILVCVISIEEIRKITSECLNLPPRTYKPPFLFIAYKNTFFYILPVAASLLVKIAERLRHAETGRKNLENEQLKSELNHLRYQLNPHFFLNTLNNIYYLTDHDPEKAKETIHALGKMMRYLLYEITNEHIPLSYEISFLQKYIDLMKLRLRKDVLVNVSFPEQFTDKKIAPLLLIPLVENAFKHGINATEPSFIHIKLKVEEHVVAFYVTNSYFPKTDADQSGSGIGIENLKRRLALLYPSSYELTQNIVQNEFHSSLTIQL